VGDGPIDSLSYREFTFQVSQITLPELREHFADELAKLEEEEEEQAV
jgi:hypothetical protein